MRFVGSAYASPNCHRYFHILIELNRKAKLDTLTCANRPLFEIHSMEEQSRLFREKADRKEAGEFLTVWCRDVPNSRIKTIKRAGKTLTG